MIWMALGFFMILALVFALVAVLVGRVRLRLIHLVIYSIPLLLVSLVQYTRSWHLAVEFGLLVSALCGGYALARVWLADRPKEPRMGVAPSWRVAPLVTLFVAAATAYHFSKVGVPLFASNTELSRFNLGASGLMGVPSRMYLYGVFVACAIAVAEATRARTRLSRDRWVRAAFAVLLMSRILSGFKSGLLQVLLFAALVAVVSTGGFFVTRYLGRAALGFAVAVVFVFLVGSTYGSYANSGHSLLGNLEARVTSQAAEPVAITMRANRAALDDPRSAISIDIGYFANRYFGIGSSQPYGFTRLVASHIAGGSPYGETLIAPVTLTGYGSLFYDFHWLAVLLVAGVGGLLAFIEQSGPRARSRPAIFCLYCSLGEAASSFLDRGELVYTAINWTMTLGVVGIVACVAAFVDATAITTRPRAERAWIPEEHR